jgi:uncharacterized protein (UPF0332 family)
VNPEVELSKYRLEKAKECLCVAKENFANKHFSDSTNRAYYAVFHSIRAILILDNLDYKRHSAVIAKFRELYIKTEIFPHEMSYIIGQAFQIRNSSDYDDLYIVTSDQAEKQIEDAEWVVSRVTQYLAKICDD